VEVLQKDNDNMAVMLAEAKKMAEIFEVSIFITLNPSEEILHFSHILFI